MRRVAVYCGANGGFDPKYVAKAKELGQWLVNNDYELVYGGGKLGLMGAIANSVLEAGGVVNGVMPTFLVDREQAHPNLTHLEIVDTMAVRKAKMLEMADVCIALPGGPGTIEEISEAYSLYRVGQSDNPVIMFNQDGYYDGFEKLYDEMVDLGFLSTADREGLFFSESFEEIGNFINEQLAHPRDFKPQNIISNSNLN